MPLTKQRQFTSARPLSLRTLSPERVLKKLSSTTAGTASRQPKRRRRNFWLNYGRSKVKSQANTNNMLSSEAKLSDKIFDKPEMVPTRDGFGKGLLELGEKNKNVVALCADLAESTRMLPFKEKYPERYIELGVAEQNLATVAAGLANYGKIPFIASYATFSPGRNN